MLLCQRVLVAKFLTWVITSHICEIFGCTEIALNFHWLVKLSQRRSLSLLSPPPPSLLPPIHVLPNYMYTLIWSGKGQKANREYIFLNSPLTEITSYKIVLSNACSLVSVHVSTFVPRLRDKALRGKRSAGDIICMIPPAPPPKLEAAPDGNFPFPQSISG